MAFRSTFLSITVLALSACGGSAPANWFVGRVYDGASGRRFDTYRLELEW